MKGILLVLYHYALQNFLRQGCIGPKWVSSSSHSLSQEFYSTVRDKCWEKCITKPSSSLSSSEQTCLARCCDRYAEVILTLVLFNHILRQHEVQVCVWPLDQNPSKISLQVSSSLFSGLMS